MLAEDALDEVGDTVGEEVRRHVAHLDQPVVLVVVAMPSGATT